jgi:hypothetical protein
MKRLVLFCAIALAAFTGACSGGVGGPPPPPPTGNFSLASLNGSYAFQMSGTDINGNPISRVGSFNADGKGNITAGIEDVNDGGTINLTGSATPVVFDAAPQSTYTVLSNGRGKLTLHDASGTLTFSITLASATASSSSAGLMVETDGNATASGSFRAQTITTTFSPMYAFDFSGVDASGAGFSVVGRFTTNTTTGITGGVLDENDGGSVTSSVPITPSTITLDPTYAATFGRATANIDGLHFAFYIVDGNNVAAVEEDSSVSFLTSGFATAQNAVPTQTSAIAGSFVFDVGGSANGTTSIGPLAGAGEFQANGGTISNLVLDENFSGTASTFGAGGISNVTFTVDAAGTGRGTLAFTDVTTGDVFSYVFYLTSASGGFLQDTSSGVVADGSLFQQAQTLTPVSLAGNYIANWSGVNGRNAFEEDFNAQFAVSSAGNITGVVDYTELANSSNQIVTDAGVAGTFILGRPGQISLQAGGQTFHFHAYVISNNSILLIGTDSAHVVLGSVTRQN